MRFDLRNLSTGMGELLCFVLAWVIGAAALYNSYAGRAADRAGEKLAASSAAPLMVD